MFLTISKTIINVIAPLMVILLGEQSGYNIPEVKECSEIPRWLSDECFSDIMKNPDDKTLPEYMRRLICDAYICMYQSPEVMMFR